MYNCWNEALEYLIKKYGEKLTHTGTNFQGKGQKDTTRMVRTYNSEKVKGDDLTIVKLMEQYYYGIAAKRELYFILESKGLILEAV